MPGQNVLWDKYGCEISNDYEMLVLEVNFSGGDTKASFQSWCDKYGVRYPAVCATEGGSQFNTQLQNNNYGGPKYLIYPDRTFIKSPGQSHYDAAGLVEHIHGGTTYNLVVNSGSGDGEHAKDASVTIKADAAPSGKEFDKWTGDTGYLADPNSSTTTIIMPAKDITVTATYKDIGPVVIKDNYITISSWEAGKDDLGSNVVIDSSKKADTLLSATITMETSDQANKNWAWAQISGYTSGNFEGVTSIEIFYTSNNPVAITLDQEGLSAEGASYTYTLSAASRGKFVIPIDEFAQPDWVATSSPDLVADLDLTKIESISFAGVTEGATTNLELKGIFLEGFQSTPIGQKSISPAKSSLMAVGKLTPNKLVLSNVTEGVYEISIFNTLGKNILSLKRSVSSGSTIDFGNKVLSNGSYIVKVKGDAGSVVRNRIIR